MEEDLISIIVPVYNAERFLLDTIKTVNEQIYENWELIFVNDCSKDGSSGIINKEINKNSKIRLINLEKNSGAAIARNKGIDNANGRYITFLDSDDLWDKEKLKKQVEFMKKNNSCFSYTGYQFADENGIPNGKKVNVPNKITYKEALKNTTISTITVMLDMTLLSKEDIYMPNIRRGQDTATWWKILKKINNADGLNEILSFYRRTSDSLSSNKLIALKRTWNLYRNVEHLNIFYSIYNFLWYCFNALKRRI